MNVIWIQQVDMPSVNHLTLLLCSNVYGVEGVVFTFRGQVLDYITVMFLPLQQEVKPGDVLNKKNLWENLGDSPGNSGPGAKVFIFSNVLYGTFISVVTLKILFSENKLQMFS